jgi:hypothetical protein
MAEAKKTIVFYGTDAKAAREKHPEVAKDSYQVIQADAWHGERLEADEYEFMDDVAPGDKKRIEEIWGKFDNRQNIENTGPTTLAGVERTPASDRRNLNPETRVDNPKDVKENQIEKRPGFAPKVGDAATVDTHSDKKGVGLDQTTGLKTDDRNKIPRSEKIA